jgi:hypothetical protein
MPNARLVRLSTLAIPRHARHPRLAVPRHSLVRSLASASPSGTSTSTSTGAPSPEPIKSQPQAKPKSSTFQTAKKYAVYAGYFGLSTVVGVITLGAGIFIHDAFTYTEKHIDRVPINPLALHPESGGPKDLPIVKAYIGDQEDDENIRLAKKPKLVIIGGGWGVS